MKSKRCFRRTAPVGSFTKYWVSSRKASRTAGVMWSFEDCNIKHKLPCQSPVLFLILSECRPLFSRFCWESVSLSLCCCALACVTKMAATFSACWIFVMFWQIDSPESCTHSCTIMSWKEAWQVVTRFLCYIGVPMRLANGCAPSKFTLNLFAQVLTLWALLTSAGCAALPLWGFFHLHIYRQAALFNNT